MNYYRWWDQYYFLQDEWRIIHDLTLNLGIRYEVPGNNIQSLIDLNQRILQATGNNPVFRLTRPPGRIPTTLNLVWASAGATWAVRWSRVARARRLRADPRLRVSQYRPEHRQLFSLYGAATASNLPSVFTVLQSIPLAFQQEQI